MKPHLIIFCVCQARARASTEPAGLLSHLINHICANQKVGTQYVDVALCVVKAGSTMRARWPDKFRLAYPRNKTNPQRYQFSEEPQIYLRCSTLESRVIGCDHVLL
jgi:hypothetical protein